MNAAIEIVPSVLDRIRKTLVGLKMPRALEVIPLGFKCQILSTSVWGRGPRYTSPKKPLFVD